MMILIGILIAFAFIGIALISRSVTTFFHEMGHALPSLWYTEGEVCVYVGSYGDISKSLHFKIGRLRTYLKFNFLSWNLGMCTHQQAASFWANILIIIGGPLASLLFAGLLLYLMIYQGYSDNTIAFMAIFVLAALIDFFVNIIPSGRPMLMHDGSRLYNDGTQLQRLLEMQAYPSAYFEALEQYHKGEKEAAIQQLQSIFQSKKPYRGMYYPVLDLLVADKDYGTALQLYEQMVQYHQLKAVDYAQLGDIHMGRNDYPETLKYFNQALYYKYKDALLLNKRGYLYQQLSEHSKALADFNAAVHYGGHFATLYSNRSLSKLKCQDPDGALSDLQLALALEPKHPAAHMHLGLYYKEIEDYPQAFSYLEKAKALGVKHHGIDYQIEMVRRLLPQ